MKIQLKIFQVDRSAPTFFIMFDSLVYKKYYHSYSFSGGATVYQVEGRNIFDGVLGKRKTFIPERYKVDIVIPDKKYQCS